MPAKKTQELGRQSPASSGAEQTETVTKKRGRPKKVVNEEIQIESKSKLARKSTVKAKRSSADVENVVDTSSPNRMSRSWEDIAQEADTLQLQNEIQVSNVTISTIREDVSRRRIAAATTPSSKVVAGKTFSASNISIQPPILRQQAALMSTKTPSSSSSAPSNAARSATRTGAQAVPRTPRATTSSGQTITGELPAGYQKKARQWTMLIVSVPFVLVSSWWMYERCKLFHFRISE
jgi:hypothetical protein